MLTLTARQRLVTALSRGKPDRVPRDISWGFSPALLEVFRAKTGYSDPDEHFKTDVRFVFLEVPPERAEGEAEARRARFGRYFSDLPTDATFTEWGTAHVPGSFYHFVHQEMPMQSFAAVSELESYPFPTLCEPWRQGYASKRIADWHAQDLAVGGFLALTIFETAWALRGMEQLFSDFVENPEFARILLDRITDVQCQAARFFAESEVDVLVLGDDVSMQTGMLMSPATWRHWFKGRLARVIAAARAIKPDLHILYHSDGNPTAIIPELIEIGVTVLNPVQPECVDPAELKRTFGEHLAFWGTIGTQTTMPFGKPEDVYREVKLRMETVGYDGGLVIGPTHLLEPDVPWENVVALYDAIDKFGVYA